MEIFRAAGLSRLPGGSRLRYVSEEEQYHQSGRYRAGSASASQSNQRLCKIRAENAVHSPIENWPLTLISKLNFKSEKIINLK